MRSATVYLCSILITYGYRTLEGVQPVFKRASMTYSAVSHRTTMVKVLPYVMRSINELNIPVGNRHGFEILYFGVNLILMLDYRLSFNIEVLCL
jgi:hypothetical protein